ncbi:Phytoene synthase [plant metagenome]|uniref:Phytoene synthase n=1 Tax=plant metagenome TaxID=1297885 RepID=A0A484TAI3_9ZZZZ
MGVNHYENFPVASLLLPARLRRAVSDIYRYARTADDIADEGNAHPHTRLSRLAEYRAALHRIGSRPGCSREVASGELSPIFEPLAETITRHQLPIAPFYDLLSAFEQDVSVHRYNDYDTLLDYCTRSANPVGRLMLHLYGAADPGNLRESDAICTGLQLVNFWQDVHQDWNKGRVYLPQQDMQRYEVTEKTIATQQVTPAWTALMRCQTQRARTLLHFGAPLARRLSGRIGLELRLVIQGGLRILERIDAVQGDIFLQRPVLRPRDWAIMLWRARV